MNPTRLLFGGLALLGIATAASAQPAAADPRLVVELVARQPDIKTPTGIAVDERGRVWVIENNTHFRPKDYDGHPSDRILVFADLADDGKARQRSTFADGFKDSMSIALHRDAVYLATRSDIFVLKDTDGDGQADEKNRIIRLETKGDYPHNGLSGFAFDPLGNMYFSLGENLGVPYKLIGSDGSTLAGGGEGGNIYRARPDGSKLQQVATGFWNTYHLCFDAFGRLFAVDNDPDSRPPCRLLHIVQGGDYGYRFRNGRKGLHPFTAWNGELPGTLPMVAGTGEAPSGIVAYESTGLPAEYRGKLLVTSWGDHIVQCFTLKEKGASFSATATNLLQGGEHFRPVGIARHPPAFHALALRMIRPDHPKIPPEKLSAFLKSQDEPLRREAVRTLALRTDANSQQVLRQLAADVKLPADLRADAIAGLTHSAASEPSRKLLFELLADETVRREALRALRGEPAAAGQVIDWWEKTAAKDRELAAQVVRLGQGNQELAERLKPVAALAGPRPANPADWKTVLGADGDAAAGERLFFHPKGPACFACHRVNGRGGLVGPDLSRIAASANRDRLIESIVQPSKEIAPQFTTYAVETKAGQVHTGLIMAEDPRGELVLADAQGQLLRIKLADIEERRALPTSIMPENVHELMTPAELRDLIAYLSALK